MSDSVAYEEYSAQPEFLDLEKDFQAPAAPNDLIPWSEQTEDFIHGTVLLDGHSTSYSLQRGQGDNPFPDLLFIFVPGYGGKKFTSGIPRNALSEAGVHALSYEPFRFDNRSAREQYKDPQKLHSDTIGLILGDLATRNNVPVRFSKHEEANESLGVFLIPHSMGHLAAVGFAKDRPQTVEGIISCEGVGYGSPNIGQLVEHGIKKGPRMLWDIARLIKNHSFPLELRYAAGELAYFLANPIRSAGEGVSCLTNHVGQDTLEIRKANTRVAVINGEIDALVDHRPEDVEEFVDVYCSIEKAGHLLPFEQPDLFSAVILELTRDLKKIRDMNPPTASSLSLQ